METSLFRLLIQPRHWVAAFSLSLLWLVNLLPYPVKIRVGMGLGKLLYYVLRNRRHIAMVNLRLCFPEMSEEERDLLVRDAFKNFGAGVIETAMGWWTEDKKVHQRVSYEGREHLDAAIAKGKGVILVGAHFSSIFTPSIVGRKINWSTMRCVAGARPGCCHLSTTATHGRLSERFVPVVSSG